MRNIEFQIIAKGDGIVNYDSKDTQKAIMGKLMHSVLNNNIKVGKKLVHEDGDGNLSFTPIIDANCYRHAIMGKALDSFIARNLKLFIDQATSWQNLMRGYTLATKDNTFTRKSPVCLSDLKAERRTLPNMTIETSDTIDPMTNKRSETSMFFVEKLGETEWHGRGNIDVAGLRFISCSEQAGRPAFPEDKLDEYFESLERRFGHGDIGTKGMFKIGASHTPESGIMLSEGLTSHIIREFLKALLSVSIRRATSYVKTEKLLVRPMNTVVDFPNDEEGWIEVNSIEDIDALDLGSMDVDYRDVTQDEYDGFLADIELIKKSIMSDTEKKEKEKKSKSKKEEEE